jgi:putative endonuclease
VAVVVYIVECADRTLYTGWTTDIEQRLRLHNAGRGAKYTRSRTPVRLVYAEEQPDRSAALQRELQIKRMRREQKLQLICGYQRPEVQCGDDGGRL